MKIVERDVNDLIEAEYNPRQMTADQRSALLDSLKRFGMVDPIIVNTHKDRKNIVIGGHQRLRIWKSLGKDTIPTVEVKLDRDKERELNIRLNKNVGEWDWDALANEFDIGELGDLGFSEHELGLVVGEVEQAIGQIEKYEPKPPELTWVLIACPTRQFGEIAEAVEAIGQIEGVQTETAVTDEQD